MPRLTAREKALTLLTDGRVILTHARPGVVVRAHVRGDGAVHRCGWDAGTWWCSCKASTYSRSASCSHLIALRMITAPDLTNKENRNQ